MASLCWRGRGRDSKQRRTPRERETSFTCSPCESCVVYCTSQCVCAFSRSRISFFSYQINTNTRVLDFYSKTSGRCQNKTYLPESLPQYLSLCKRTWKQTALKPRSWKDGSGADDALMVSLRSAETPRTLALRPIVRVAELFSLLTGCLSQWQASGSQLYSV